MLAFWVQNGRIEFRVLAQAGGMPSSHAAMVSSLVTAVGYQYGLDSGLFAIAVALAVIVMYDARGVRQESGKQARVINQILQTFFQRPSSHRSTTEGTDRPHHLAGDRRWA